MSFITYLKDTKKEFAQVNWPTRKQAILYTVAVVAVSGLISLYLSFFDQLIELGLAKLIIK
jgi:preprotein translocase SecE subunit